MDASRAKCLTLFTNCTNVRIYIRVVVLFESLLCQTYVMSCIVKIRNWIIKIYVRKRTEFLFKFIALFCAAFFPASHSFQCLSCK